MDSNSPIPPEAQNTLRSDILRALDDAEGGTISQADAILAIMNTREWKLEAEHAIAREHVSVLIATLRELQTLFEARNVAMEQALGLARENRTLMLEWQRRYELETVICARAFTERDEAQVALQKVNTLIESMRELALVTYSRNDAGRAVGFAESIQTYD